MKKLILLFLITLSFTICKAQKQNLILLKNGELLNIKTINQKGDTLYYYTVEGESGMFRQKEVYGTMQYPDSLPKFHNNKFTFEPVIFHVPGKSAHELYQNAIEWIKNTYENPDKVIKTTIPDKEIRLRGYQENIAAVKVLFYHIYGGYYTIILQFKKGKYRMSFLPEGFEVDNKEYGFKLLYKRNGKIYKMNRPVLTSYQFNVNKISLSIYEYLSGKTKNDINKW